MARLEAARCPNCGAGVTIPAAGEWATCSYCGTSSFVNRTAARKLDPSRLPVGTRVIQVPQKSSGPAIAVASVVFLALAGGAVALYALLPAVMSRSPLGLGGFRQLALIGRIFLMDANGDGVDDVMIQGFYIPNAVMHVRAIDGTNGSVVWESEPFMKPGQEEVVAATPGSVVALVNGIALGLDPRTGKKLYEVSLPERGTAVCQHQGGVAILAKDDKLYPLNPRTGALSMPGLAKPEKNPWTNPGCVPVSSDLWASHGGLLRQVDTSDFGSVAGMRVSSALESPSDETILLVGERAQGSRVPMIGVAAAKRVLWKSDVPGKDPLNAREGEPAAITLAGGRAFAAYVDADGESLRVASFAAGDGSRLWEETINAPSKPTFVQLAGDGARLFVYVSDGPRQTLQSLDAKTGQVKWST